MLTAGLRLFFQCLIAIFIALELAMLAFAIFGPDLMIGGPNVGEIRLKLALGASVALVVTALCWPSKSERDELNKRFAAAFRARRDREERVLREGLSGTATILARANETTDGGDTNADLTLEIRVAGRDPYPVSYFWYEPEDRAAERMRVGRVLEARVDPADANFVIVQWADGVWYTTRRA